MFSEKDIVIQCRQCSGHCDNIKNCPLKVDWPNDRKSKIIPVPVNWILSSPVQDAYKTSSEKYTTEELITGLRKLSDHL